MSFWCTLKKYLVHLSTCQTVYSCRVILPVLCLSFPPLVPSSSSLPPTIRLLFCTRQLFPSYVSYCWPPNFVHYILSSVCLPHLLTSSLLTGLPFHVPVWCLPINLHPNFPSAFHELSAFLVACLHRRQSWKVGGCDPTDFGMGRSWGSLRNVL